MTDYRPLPDPDMPSGVAVLTWIDPRRGVSVRENPYIYVYNHHLKRWIDRRGNPVAEPSHWAPLPEPPV